MLINEIFNVSSGQVMSRITTETNEVEVRKVLLPKAINFGSVVESELVDNKMKVFLEPEKMSMEKDLIIKLSTPYNGCIIDSSTSGLVVPSFCAILRLKDYRYDLFYVLAYINSKAFAEQVLRLVTGNTIGILSISQLKSLDIPLLPLEKQKAIGNEFMKMSKNKQLLDRLINLQQEKIETLIAAGGKYE